MNRWARTWVAGGAALLLAGTAACGSSSKTHSTSSATTAAPSGSAGSTAPTPSGTPITAVFINDSGTQTNTDDAEGIKIGVDAINAAGGVKGHPIHITTCSTDGNAAGATKCGRDAVSDASAVAVVGTPTSFSTELDPILTAASMPSIGNDIFSAGDFDCTVCFADAAGIFDSIGSGLAAVRLTGAKNVGVPYIDLPAGAELAPIEGGLIKPFGAKVVGAVPVPVTATDLSPVAAAEGAAKPDVIIDGLTTALFSGFIHAYRQQGFKTPIIVSGGVYDASGVASELSGVNSDIEVAGEYNYNSTGYKTFLADFAKYGGGYSNHDDEVLRTWLAVQEFSYAVSHATSVTRAGLLAAMRATTAWDSMGLLPPINYSRPSTAFGGKAPTVYVQTVWLNTYSDGKLIPIGKGEGVDVFTGALVSTAS